MILFGAGKLPSVIEDIGRGLRNLKREMQDGQNDSSSMKKPDR
ncbi:MAG: hypothetical protein P857_789 [Candidatus Xenolissoclinum pacificiensis L6]|uniref:Uncharacterized protein n=1 Tax=Candidatus Xenolissoclinum pacificiensis L6 TaxID=1401685 RepID=W2V0J1_9RICK|nr:MAG: hypothetical protein P857_789 [Candidatus Xenolissoclinum pacificiensis L6]